MELVHGEAIGRRIVEGASRRSRAADGGGAREDPCDPAERLPFLPDPDLWQRLYAELDSVDEPHPAIELGIAWCRERLPLDRPRVVDHGDFRIGNLMVDEDGIVAVLDWEFAHLADPAEDLAWPLIRAWRFGNDGLRLGGIGDVEPYLERYAELTGLDSRSTSCSSGRCSATASGRSGRSRRLAATSAARSGASSWRSSAGSRPRWSTSCST